MLTSNEVAYPKTYCFCQCHATIPLSASAVKPLRGRELKIDGTTHSGSDAAPYIVTIHELKLELIEDDSDHITAIGQLAVCPALNSSLPQLFLLIHSGSQCHLHLSDTAYHLLFSSLDLLHMHVMRPCKGIQVAC